MVANIGFHQFIDGFYNDFSDILFPFRDCFQIPCKYDGQNDDNGHYNPHHNDCVGDGEFQSKDINGKEIIWLHYVAYLQNEHPLIQSDFS
jgi:hypothetical protein